MNFIPVATVVSPRIIPDDDYWGNILSEIVLEPHIPDESLLGIESQSHLEIIFHFNALPEDKIVVGARHPRDNKNWPLTGIFAQRGAGRPNRLGATIVELIEVRKRSIVVKGLDAIHGTPVVDIKPVWKEFFPSTEIRQPGWSHELMTHYWH